MAGATTQTPETPSNSISRIASVLFSPKATFASIAQRPTWLAPIVLGVIVSLGLYFVFGSRVGWQRAVERNIQNSPMSARQMDQLTPEQRQQNIAMQVKFYPYIFYTLAVVGPFLFTAILAAILLGLFNLAYGAQLSFKNSMAVVAYAFLPLTLYSLVGTFVIFLKDPSQVDIQNLLASNPGALMSTETARWIVVLASRFDFFAFWVMILLAMGYSAANPKKVSMGGALVGIVGLWLFWVIVVTGFTAAVS